jgi:hypothetical protein
MNDPVIDVMLMDVPYPALYKLAAWHDKQATIIRAWAHRLELSSEMKGQVDKRHKFLQQLPATVAKYLRQGIQLQTAIVMTSQHANVPIETVEARWRDWINNKNGQSLDERNRLIVDLSSILKNAQIGERVGMHPNSVSRIISQEKRKNMVFHGRDERPGLRSITQRTAEDQRTGQFAPEGPRPRCDNVSSVRG